MERTKQTVTKDLDGNEGGFRIDQLWTSRKSNIVYSRDPLEKSKEA